MALWPFQLALWSGQEQMVLGAGGAAGVYREQLCCVDVSAWRTQAECDLDCYRSGIMLYERWGPSGANGVSPGAENQI